MDPRVSAREFIRAVRGRRSQRAFSRRLGYTSNVVAKWESGRRMPTAAEALRACKRAGIDVQAGFARFRKPSAALLGSLGDTEVAAWLAAQRGAQPISGIAQRAGFSRYRVARFLAGATRPRLPEFFALVEAMTGRLCELIAGLVDIERVPSLKPAYAQMRAAREAAFAQPWSAAVLALLATRRYAASARGTAELARTLGIAVEVVESSIGLLREAGVVFKRRGAHQVRSALVVDTRNDPQAALGLRGHWSRASHERLHAPRDADLFSYQVFSASRADYARLRQLQRDFFQQMRAIAVASEPSEVAGLMLLHLVQWDPEAG